MVQYLFFGGNEGLEDIWHLTHTFHHRSRQMWRHDFLTQTADRAPSERLVLARVGGVGVVVLHQV
jgi:hypothetical protein